MEASIVKFLKAVGKLKRVKRTGWVIRGVKDPESVAEHSYRTAVTAMVVCDIEGLDSGKAVKMALLHDLQESIVGDMTRESPNFSDKRKLEEEAMVEILGGLPNKLAGEYMDLWREYLEGITPEARVVKNADKLEMLLQAKEYEEQGYDVRDFWEEKYEFKGLAEGIYKMLK
jgi:putative hydrolase of HD superfamily